MLLGFYTAEWKKCKKLSLLIVFPVLISYLVLRVTAFPAPSRRRSPHRKPEEDSDIIRMDVAGDPSKLRNPNEPEFQAGDFAGDYEMLVREKPQKRLTKALRHKRLKKQDPLQDSEIDFDTYPEHSGSQEGQIEAPLGITEIHDDSEQNQQQFDDPTHENDPANPSGAQLEKEIKEIEAEIKSLEQEKAGGEHVEHGTVKANLTFNLRWKQPQNLTDVDTMELKYEVNNSHSARDVVTVEVMFFIVIPTFAVLLVIYLAISLYWTKCWLFKVVPPDRFYKFERYEIDQDEDPTDMAPLLRTPLQALQVAEAREHAKLEGVPDEYQMSDEEAHHIKNQKIRRKTLRDKQAAADDGYGLAEYDIDGRAARKAHNSSGERHSRDRHSRAEDALADQQRRTSRR